MNNSSEVCCVASLMGDQEADFDVWLLRDPALAEAERLIEAANGREANAARRILAMVTASKRPVLA